MQRSLFWGFYVIEHVLSKPHALLLFSVWFIRFGFISKKGRKIEIDEGIDKVFPGDIWYSF